MMTITFQHHRGDYLQYFLYVASKDIKVRSRLQTLRLVLPLVYLVISLLILLTLEIVWIAVVLIGLSLLWYMITPSLYRSSYIKSYNKFIANNLNEQIHHPVELTFEASRIVEKYPSGSIDYLFSEFVEVVELKRHLLFISTQTTGLVVPKKSVPDLDYLKDLLKERSIRYRQDLVWDETRFI